MLRIRNEQEVYSMDFMKHLTPRGKLALGVVALLLIALLAITIYFSYKKAENIAPPLIPLAEVTEKSVSNAVKQATGDNLSPSEATELVKKINKAWDAKSKPQYEAVVASEAVADKKAGELAKVDKADMVTKQVEKSKDIETGKESITMKYTSVTLDKKNAIGVYTDINKDGSAGVYYRNNRTTVAVGKGFTDGQIKARISQDLARW